MESPRALSALMSGTPADLQRAAYSHRLPSISGQSAVWVGIWGDRTVEGTLSECLDYLGIYGSARDFHMREARRTGQTGGDLWRVRRLQSQVAC
ncbi:MAG: hypothetical protein AAFY30_11160 [Cyanobacteria bacterium J06642_12]